MGGGYLSVKNWDKFQQYKDDRPMVFIRVDVGVLDDYEMEQLTEIQQNHLMKIWLLAGRCGNKIINDSAWIGRKINAKSKVNINQLVKCGFLIPDTPVLDRTVSYGDSELLALEEKRREEIRREENIGQFESWYLAYPKKVGRVKAQKAWNTIKDRPSLDTLLTALDDQIANEQQWQGGTKYIPNPASYLNGRKWEDDVQKQQQHVDTYTRPDVQSRAFKTFNPDAPVEVAPGINPYGDEL